MYYKRNTDAHSRNHCCERGVSITYSECVSVALVIQHVMRMRRVLLSYWCVCVWSWSLDNGKAPAHWGLFRHKEVSEAYTLQ
jgi:hypothetical protein